jgi:hypothetical protein
MVTAYAETAPGTQGLRASDAERPSSRGSERFQAIDYVVSASSRYGCEDCYSGGMDPTCEPRVLVVYYSRTGNTAFVAEGLARACEADVEPILASIPRRGVLGYLFSGFEATFERESLTLPPQRNPHDYDVVLIGGPIWNSTVSSPVRAYLKRFAGSLPDVGFFVTSGGGEDERIFLQMAELSGKKPLAVLGLRARDLKGRFAVYLGEFWESVISAWEARVALSNT